MLTRTCFDVCSSVEVSVTASVIDVAYVNELRSTGNDGPTITGGIGIALYAYLDLCVHVGGRENCFLSNIDYG